MTKDKQYYEEWAERLHSEIIDKTNTHNVMALYGKFPPFVSFDPLQMAMLDRMIREIVNDSVAEMTNEIIKGNI